MKLVVFGSRSLWVPRWFISDLSRRKFGRLPTAVISGTAAGADASGEAWARCEGLPLVQMPADWDEYGRAAGYRRNVEMSYVADVGLGFWDGKSRGTAHMWKAMTRLCKPCHVEVI
jgi:hypothetical protein